MLLSELSESSSGNADEDSINDERGNGHVGGLAQGALKRRDPGRPGHARRPVCDWGKEERGSVDDGGRGRVQGRGRGHSGLTDPASGYGQFIITKQNLCPVLSCHSPAYSCTTPATCVKSMGMSILLANTLRTLVFQFSCICFHF